MEPHSLTFATKNTSSYGSIRFDVYCDSPSGCSWVGTFSAEESKKSHVVTYRGGQRPEQWIVHIRLHRVSLGKVEDYWEVKRDGFLRVGRIRSRDMIEIVDNPTIPQVTEEDIACLVEGIQRSMEIQNQEWANVFRNVLKSIPKYSTCNNEQVETLHAVFVQSPELHDIVSSKSTLWNDYYKPFTVSPPASTKFLTRILKSKHPFLTHVYFRSTFMTDSAEVRFHTIVHYHFDLDHNHEENGRNVARVSEFRQIQTYDSNMFAGPKDIDRFMDDFSDDAVENAHNDLSTMLLHYLESRADDVRVDDEISIPWRENDHDDWESIEVNVFTRKWYSELHTQTSLEFQCQVKQLLLAINRQEVSSKLGFGCIQHIIEFLYEEEADVRPLPVFRVHLRRSNNEAEHQPLASDLRLLLTNLSAWIGMTGGPQQWVEDDDEEASMSFLAREECPRLSYGADWTQSSKALPPLVFRRFSSSDPDF